MKIRNELFIIILYVFSVMNADAAAVVSRSSRASISRAPTISVNTNTSTTSTTSPTKQAMMHDKTINTPGMIILRITLVDIECSFFNISGVFMGVFSTACFIV